MIKSTMRSTNVKTHIMTKLSMRNYELQVMKKNAS